MKFAVIDGNAVTSMEDIHKMLAQQLAFPEWYGNNLDALHDVLTDCCEKTVIAITDLPLLEEHLGDYAVYFQRVLHDCAQENPHLRILQ